MNFEIKNVLKKLVISVLCIMILCQTLLPTLVEAKSIKEQIKEAVSAVICLPADGINFLLQSSLLGINEKVVLNTADDLSDYDPDAFWTGFQDYLDTEEDVGFLEYTVGSATVTTVKLVKKAGRGLKKLWNSITRKRRGKGRR